MQKMTLESLIEFNPKVKLEKQEYYDFIPMENINPNEKFVSSIEKSLWDSNSGSKFENGDVLFARIFPCLDNKKIAVAKTDGKGFGSTEFFVLRAKKGISDPNFIYYLSKTDLVVQNAINSYVGASGRQRADLNFIKRCEVEVPELPNQQKIAGILSAYDELIENNKKRIALLETMAEELYKEWFVRFRFPNYENTEFEIGMPKNWQREEINHFCQEVKKSIKQENLNFEQKYIGLEHLSRKDFAIYNYATADTVDSDKLEFQKNDILFGKIRPYLHKVCLANFNGVCSTDIIVIRAKNELFFSYILLTIFSNTFVDLANVSSNGTKMPRANWGYLKKVKIPLPPQDLLKKFNEICLPMFQQIDILLQENELLISKKNQLLPRLISGKLSVENLDIQQPPTPAQPTDNE